MSYIYTVRIPAGKRAQFRAMVKELGGSVAPGQTAYERSKEEARTGKVHKFATPGEMFAALDS